MLRAGHVNVYHLLHKVTDIAALLHNAESTFHLFGITESRLKDKMTDTDIAISSYSIWRRDKRVPGQTGVMVYVHDSIKHITRRRKDLEPEEVECMWLEVKPDVHSPSLLVCYLYRNPAETYDWYDKFVSMMDNVYSLKNKTDVLLLGDFNINLLKPHPCWQSTTALLGLTPLINSPTRVTHSTSSLLDHIYTNNPEKVIESNILDVSVSDHNPIACTLSYKLPKPDPKGHTYVSYRSFKHFDKDAFLLDLQLTHFNVIFDLTDADMALEVWYRLFLSVLNKHAPIKTRRVKSPTLPPWLTAEIIETMAQRDQVKKNKLFDEYKKIRNKVKNLIRNEKKKFFNTLVGNTNDISRIWRALNIFVNGQQSKTNQVPRTFSAEDYNRYFLTIANELLDSSSQPMSKYTCPEPLARFCQDRLSDKAHFSIPLMGVHEVGKIIESMENKKSCGLDQISSKVLKLSLPYIVDSLTYIYNLCIINNVFPTQLKGAKVIPLPKTKNANELNEFRPISVLPVLSKPLEKHIHNHLVTYLESNNLFHQLQSGFRSHHSCSTALARLSNSWLTAVNHSEVSADVFLDLRKAFDLVDHSILLSKLSEYLNYSPTIRLFQSYLNDRRQSVYVHGKYSAEGTIQYGVPQGSILGPVLFCIFINDLPLHIQQTAVECHMLADDTTVHTSGKDMSEVEGALQVTLDSISEWCLRNRMRINPSKTKSMIITTRQKHQLTHEKLNLVLDDKVIEQVSEHRLLGVVVDEKLRWDAQIEDVCKKLSRNLFLLSRLQYLLNVDTRKLFYNAHIKPHIDYASVIWDGSSEALLKKVNSLHRRAAKLILPEPSLSTEEKMAKVGMLSLQNQFLFNKAVLMHKVNYATAPSYLTELFSLTCSRYSGHKSCYSVPRPRVDIFKTSFSYAGASLWKTLPLNITSISSLPSFKKVLRAHFSAM